MKVRGTPSLLLMLCLTGLAACTSKPDSADIQKELAQMYQCPLLSMSEVKKTSSLKSESSGSGRVSEKEDRNRFMSSMVVFLAHPVLQNGLIQHGHQCRIEKVGLL